MRWPVLVLWLAVQTWLASACAGALPRRLILAVDSIAYRDMKALQAGVTCQDSKGRPSHRQAFHRGYFPVSRMISTFPSTSDVAWTEILGDRPLPGYQRTYFSQAANAEIRQGGVTTTMEYERQMTWQDESGFRRGMSYVKPRAGFEREVHDLVEGFLQSQSAEPNYYAYIRSTDVAQHMACDPLTLLCILDEALQDLRVRYRAREGRDLEILLLSDHGNNHAGPGKRVQVRALLKKAGYRITQSISTSRDVVLPTAGIESWVEVHNAPAETERLLQLLSRLEGVDILTARVPGATNRFVVMNSKGERAIIEHLSARNAFRYSTETGDPIGYRPVVERLLQKNQLDSDGFGAADAWLAETLALRYPLALERIVRAHTRVTLNPASILISLSNDYVHANWLVKTGSRLMKFGGTHGGLDDLSSSGMLLSNFIPTPDTATTRVAGLFEGFPGLRDYRAQERGAEWVSANTQASIAIKRGPCDATCQMLPKDQVFLRIWAPDFAQLEASVEITVKKARQFSPPQIRRGDPPPDSPEQRWRLDPPVVLPSEGACDRVYALPSGLVLEPRQRYEISGRIRAQKQTAPSFKFIFYTDSRSLPVAY
jgi:hypothetical protein